MRPRYILDKILNWHTIERKIHSFIVFVDAPSVFVSYNNNNNNNNFSMLYTFGGLIVMIAMKMLPLSYNNKSTHVKKRTPFLYNTHIHSFRVQKAYNNIDRKEFFFFLFTQSIHFSLEEFFFFISLQEATYEHFFHFFLLIPY